MNQSDSIYLNWAMYAVVGLMGEADALRREYPNEINAVADKLRKRFPIPEGPLYRGMLLDEAGTVRVKPNLTFLSWSEDRDVARWFGSRGSYISEPFVENFPEVRGFVLTLPAVTPRVLFHYSWRRPFLGIPIERLAAMHPLIGTEGARQIQWSLDTQHEVVTEPLTELPPAVPVEDVPGATMAELNDRLTPAWIKAQLARREHAS